jgi:glucose-6-phosphate 1-dehydrogenase
LPNNTHIVGYARSKIEPQEYTKRVTSYIKISDEEQDAASKLGDFKNFNTYVSGGYEDDESFQNLNRHLEEIESKYQGPERHRLFYFALPPSVFIPVAQHLKRNCYSQNGTTRVIVEKPFGKDLDSAHELIHAISEQFTESETFRIDHYLGKEMVKNLLVLRFANIAFSSSWDKNSISNVQITFKEPFGTEGRGGYFDEFGIIRDVLQNRGCACFIIFFTPTLCSCSTHGANTFFGRLASSAQYSYHGAASVILC